MKETKICVIGLGYVGLPLARLFSSKYRTIGFDMNAKRCEALMAGHDSTLEVSDELLQDAINNHGFLCTADIEQIKDCNFYVVAVPIQWMRITTLILLLYMEHLLLSVKLSPKVMWLYMNQLFILG